MVSQRPLLAAWSGGCSLPLVILFSASQIPCLLPESYPAAVISLTGFGLCGVLWLFVSLALSLSQQGAETFLAVADKPSVSLQHACDVLCGRGTHMGQRQVSHIQTHFVLFPV